MYDIINDMYMDILRSMEMQYDKKCIDMCAVVCLFDLNPRTHHITYFVISLCIQFYVIRVSYFSECCKINNDYNILY